MLGTSLKHVRNGTEIGSFKMIYPNSNGYPASSPIYSGSSLSIPLANENLAEHTSGYLYEGYPTQCTIMVQDGDSDARLDCGFGQYGEFDMTDIQVGDRLVCKNGSYIECTYRYYTDGGGVSYNYHILQLTFRYYTVDDELVYSGVNITNQWRVSQVIGSHYEYQAFLAIPWRWSKSDNEYKIGSGSIIGDWQLMAAVPYHVYSFAWRGYTSPTSAALGAKFFNGIPDEDPNDPYPDIDDSEPDDPDNPDGVPEPDPIPIPPDPDIDVTDLGFVTLFAPTKAQLANLATYMWSGAFDLNSFRKIFADPMDCILGLNILPFTVPRGSLAYVRVGNISTEVSMYTANKQWVTVDCGAVNVGKVYDTYLDYAPYTKWSIYLPFIGIQQLNTDDVAHKTLRLRYRIDVLSCACIAYLLVDDRVLYQFAGTCGYSVPVTSANYAQMYANMIAIGASAAGILSGGVSGAASLAGEVASLAGNVMGLKPTIKRSGSIGSGAGMMGVQTPYVLIEIPRLCKPARQQHFLGYPSFVTIQVSGISGYAEFENIILNTVPCTEEERDMLYELFRGGIYV